MITQGVSSRNAKNKTGFSTFLASWPNNYFYHFILLILHSATLSYTGRLSTLAHTHLPRPTAVSTCLLKSAFTDPITSGRLWVHVLRHVTSEAACDRLSLPQFTCKSTQRIFHRRRAKVSLFSECNKTGEHGARSLVLLTSQKTTKKRQRWREIAGRSMRQHAGVDPEAADWDEKRRKKRLFISSASLLCSKTQEDKMHNRKSI